MGRNPGATIDTRRWQVLDRDRRWHAFDEMVLGDAGLYYARPIADFSEFDYHWRWVLPGPGWVVNRFRFLPTASRTFDWYVEPEIVEADGHRWTIRDGYVDVYVWDGVRYEVEDVGELADGMTSGAITAHDAVRALHSLDRLCQALLENGLSGRALLERFAPDLPLPAPLVSGPPAP